MNHVQSDIQRDEQTQQAGDNNRKKNHVYTFSLSTALFFFSSLSLFVSQTGPPQFCPVEWSLYSSYPAHELFPRCVAPVVIFGIDVQPAHSFVVGSQLTEILSTWT